MQTNKMRFRYFKNEEDFIKDLKFIRQAFGEQARHSTSRSFAFPNGVTGRELSEKYTRECEKVRRYNLKYKLTPTPLRKTLPATLVYTAEYETMFSLMEILRTNFLSEEIINYAINRADFLFETYFDEKLKTRTTEDVME